MSISKIDSFTPSVEQEQEQIEGRVETQPAQTSPTILLPSRRTPEESRVLQGKWRLVASKMRDNERRKHWERLVTEARKLLGEGNSAKNATSDEQGPFLVGAFDSSNGGLIATKNIIAKLKETFSGKVRLIPILDHGNAPFGNKDRTTLIGLVAAGISLAERAKFDALVMACNTACTARKNDDDDEDGLDFDNLDVPVLDLIANTAEHVAANGGSKPVILSTEATAKDDTYQRRIEAAAEKLENPKPNVIRIGAGDKENDPGWDWATMINNLMHLSNDIEKQAFVKKQVNKYVDDIPTDATSVYLCCTHFPAFKELIEDRLKERSQNEEEGEKLRDIKVIDPIHVQVDALIKLLKLKKVDELIKRLEMKNAEVDRSYRKPDTGTIVITTGDRKTVKNSAEKLLGETPSVLLSPARSFENFNFDSLNAEIMKESQEPESTTHQETTGTPEL